MKKRWITFLISGLLALNMYAQQLKQMGWEAYGLKFKLPTEVKTEVDSEEEYAAKGPHYDIGIQMLESEGMKKSEMAEELKNIATEDQIQEVQPVAWKDNQHFHIAYLKGKLPEGSCLYAYLLAKDGSCAFFVSMIHNDPMAKTPEIILPTFKLEE